jgi:mitogen-activated protein kinase kinase 3
MLELAIGRFPFPEAKNLFEQLKRVCQDDPPRLPSGKYSAHFEDFISQWYKFEKNNLIKFELF